MDEQQSSEEIFKITQKIINIEPKAKYLSSQELTALRNLDLTIPSAGLKRTKVENTQEEQQDLEKLYEQLKCKLSRPRIERLAGRAVGVWDEERDLVRVERKDGKFGNFGFSINGQLYLEYYEALFLLEVNRLQFEYNSMTVSIEQAYLLLMGEQQSFKYQEYLVYSNLTRMGYILVKHQNRHYQTQQINTAADCVWAMLEAELQNETVEDYIKKTPYYPNVKLKFEQIKNQIGNQTVNNDAECNLQSNETANEIKFSGKFKPNLKRKTGAQEQDNWHKAKRRCSYAVNVLQHSLVDFLKDEKEYKQFKETFEKFDLIPLKLNTKISTQHEESEDETETDSEIVEQDDMNFVCSKFIINFDVYLHNEGFRKSSPHLPNFRVIILPPQQRFPTHDEIFFIHRQQLNPVPLLIVSVNDSKQMHAFLYYFS